MTQKYIVDLIEKVYPDFKFKGLENRGDDSFLLFSLHVMNIDIEYDNLMVQLNDFKFYKKHYIYTDDNIDPIGNILELQFNKEMKELIDEV